MRQVAQREKGERNGDGLRVCGRGSRASWERERPFGGGEDFNDRLLGVLASTHKMSVSRVECASGLGVLRSVV